MTLHGTRHTEPARLRSRSGFESTNPATGELLRTYRAMSEADVDIAVSEVDAAFRRWRRSSHRERSRLLVLLGAALQARRDDLARLAAIEMGKPLNEGRAEIDKCVNLCRIYADRAKGWLATQTVQLDGRSTARIICEPLGVILGVMPWNFPLWQVMRFAVPALAAGNTVVVKHSRRVTGCALALEELFRSCSALVVFRSLVIEPERVGAVIDDDRIRAVSVTGGVEAGREIASHAGAALKKVVLELGGNNAFVVLSDADLERASLALVTSRLRNAGQSCTAPKRTIVEAKVHDQFVGRVLAHARIVVPGDPFAADTRLGPLADLASRDRLHRQVRRSIELGAVCLLGGMIPEGPGSFYPPTVLVGVRPGMPAWDEELFGPVIAITRADDDASAIRLANESRYGLGASVWSRDERRAIEIAAGELDAGFCTVNSPVRSDPRLPFGGVRDSGFGRELGREGMLEFVNVKTLVVRGEKR